MTRPLVHLRERVRVNGAHGGVINMENGREDRLRLGEEDGAGAQIWWQEEAYIRQADGNPPGADEAAEEAPCDDAAVLCLLIFLLGAGTGWTLRGKMIRKLIDPSTIEMPNWLMSSFSRSTDIPDRGRISRSSTGS